MFKNPLSFKGRIRRLEYGLSIFIYFLGLLVRFSIADIFGSSDSDMFIITGLPLYVPLLWFMLAQGTKRCHDRGNPGIWQIIPFYGWWMIFADGEIGPNEYGENPKGLVYESEEDYQRSIITPIDDVDEDGVIKN